MQRLIQHFVTLSGLRDRTALNQALLQAVTDLLHPQRATLFRILQGGQRMLIQPAAELADGKLTVHDAYLPCNDLCRPAEVDAAIQHCAAEAIASESRQANGLARYCHPIVANKHVLFVLDLHLSPLGDKESQLLQSLLDFFTNHLGLIDYSETDSLTRLLNRKTFDEHMFRILGRANADSLALESELPRRRQGGEAGKSHWLAVADIDFFKKVNDTYGHLIGDEVLILVSRLMRETLRLDDQLFRFGGEEFVAILQPASREDALDVLQRVRLAIAAYPFPQAGHITVSIGFTAIQPMDTPTQLLDRADEALYYAKSHGRDQVDCFESLVAVGELTLSTTASSELELF